jgi:response regulator RpfG family c-di-GMP phosphodiesterase
LGKPHEYAVEEIRRVSGEQFDPYLVDIFMKVEPEIKQILSNSEGV